MLPAYRRRQLLIALGLVSVLLLPFAGSKLWRSMAALNAPTLPALYGEWRAEPYDIAGLRVRLPVAQYLHLQEGRVAIDQSPALPAQIRLDGDQLTVALDGEQFGSLEWELTVETDSRLYYPIPFTTSRIYFHKIGSSQTP